MDSAEAQWLASPVGTELLSKVTLALSEVQREHPEAAADPLRRTTLVRAAVGGASGPPAAKVAAALTQLELRTLARRKHGADAEHLLLTRAGLEQSTSAPLAQHRADQLVRRLTATDSSRREPLCVVDLTCGLGADLVAFGRRGLSVTGVERDPATAILARWNAARLGLAADVRLGTAEQVHLDDFDAVFCDPGRRDARGRVFDPSAYEPSWGFVRKLLTEGHAACVKAAPGLPAEAVPPGVEVELVSWRGALKESVLWSTALTQAPGQRRATLLPAGVTLLGAAGPSERAVPDVGPPAAYLLEPDPAIIRAGLVAEVAALVGGHLLHPRIAYVAATREPDASWGRTYAVREVLPHDERVLRAYVRAHHIGRLTVKKRGVEVDPVALRRRLRPRGPDEATFVLTRTSGSGVVLVCEPLR